MAKRFRAVIVFSLVLIGCFSISGYASNCYVELLDCEISQTEFEALEHSYAEYSTNSARTSGLITSKTLGIAKSGNNLLITGTTTCISGVNKCGFKTLVIQRRLNSSDSWSDYQDYEKLYIEATAYTLNKSVEVDSGYQYRVVGEHYAYKNLFSTETIDAETGYLQF